MLKTPKGGDCIRSPGSLLGHWKINALWKCRTICCKKTRKSWMQSFLNKKKSFWKYSLTFSFKSIVRHIFPLSKTFQGWDLNFEFMHRGLKNILVLLFLYLKELQFQHNFQARSLTMSKNNIMVFCK